MKVSTSYLFDRGTSQMADVQNRLAKIQAQVAQGKQVIAPSDAPEQAATIQRLKAVVAKQDDFLNTMEAANYRLQAEESALSAVSDGLLRVRELAIQAANDTLSPVDRQALALEMQGLRDQMVSLANGTDADGHYLFAGGRSDQSPYTYDAQGRVSYVGDQTRIKVLVGDQRLLALNRPGSDAFTRVQRTDMQGQAYGVGFFEVVDDLIAAVKDVNQPLIQRGADELEGLQDGISLALAQVGTDMNVVDAQRRVAEDTKLRMQTLLSSVEDLDYAEAITQMNKEMLALEAAQSSFAKIAQLNLFNYIN